jgi:DNA-binding SARP family transcriptional activator
MLRITLLGRFTASFGAELIPLPEGSKAQELLVYLLLRRKQAHTREEIASLLWEEAGAARSKAYLRKALWRLQGALEPPPGAAMAVPVVEVEGEWLRLRPDAPIWLDTAVLEAAHRQSRGILGAALNEEAVIALRDAVTLYTGDLLPNRYQAWCLEERERIKHLYLGMLEKLLEFSEASGAHELGLEYGRDILASDSTREHIHRQLMRIHRDRGDRAGALRQYRQCEQVLATELGVPPMKETTELYEHIRDSDGTLSLPPTTNLATPRNPSLRQLANRLDDMQVVLDELRRSVDHAIHAHDSRGG